ncbi:MAG: radical SAM protein [Desulfamplus sp.]|nr:radical SAM protein [Desulfamplus sp.]
MQNIYDVKTDQIEVVNPENRGIFAPVKVYEQDIDTIIEKILSGKRISIEDGLILYHQAPLLTLANLADHRRFQLHPERVITFVVDRNINYTNICMSGCLFCAFYKIPSANDGKESNGQGGYVISKESLREKIEETIDLGGTQILLQGGMNPALDLDYYIDLLKYIKNNFNIHVHGFSPPEIWWLAQKSSLRQTSKLREDSSSPTASSSTKSLSVKHLITILKDAGLDSIPGGGAEILCDEIRQKVSPNKCTTNQWLEVMESAHELGLKSSATMMFGHIESPVHIFKHLDRLRSLQDRTGGFTAFIPWTFQPDNTNLGKSTSYKLSDTKHSILFKKNTNNHTEQHRKIRKTSAVEYLRVLALSRLFLDNFDNIQASWVTQGDKIAQTALFYGANDMGSTMIEENVVASAGVDFMLPEKELRRLIEDAGFVPKQRDCFYNLIR